MKRRREVETDEFLAFARRIIRAAGKRVGDGDTIDLAGLVALRHELETIEARAVQTMREKYGYSWTEIGRDLGIKRQSAEQFYNKRIKALVS